MVAHTTTQQARIYYRGFSLAVPSDSFVDLEQPGQKK